MKWRIHAWVVEIKQLKGNGNHSDGRPDLLMKKNNEIFAVMVSSLKTARKRK